MDFIDKRLLSYSEEFSEPESDLLKDLNRETHLKVSQPRMLSGHLQGRFLSFLSKIVRPDIILEIGTYTGYASLCLAEGLSDQGKLITIDSNEETTLFAKRFIERSTYKNKIEFRSGLAQKEIPLLDCQFDLVFIDADKKNYSLYFDLVIDKVKQGGIIIADNVLWSGKVLEDQMDTETRLIHEFNQKVSHDKRVQPLLLPVRDGLMLLRKV